MADGLTDEELRLAEKYMAMALTEARKGEGGTRPNPCVGVVIVKDGQVVGAGYHAKAGGPHAEVVALKNAGEQARGADVYTTLEPCDHTGRTPPCTQALLAAGVSRVFVGCTDVNPKVSGRGIQRLQTNGISVFTGILKDECEALTAPFFKFVTTGRPFVTLKVASTADGMIATTSGHSKWITCQESLRRVHDLRHRVDAVLIGSGTLNSDDPELTARPDGVRAVRQPLRVVITSNISRLPQNARLFNSASPESPVLVLTSAECAAAEATLKNKGVEIEAVRAAPGGGVDLESVLDALGKRDVMHLLVEGGSHVFGSFMEKRLFDRIILFIAPKVLGGGISWASMKSPCTMMDSAIVLKRESVTACGEDIILSLAPSDEAFLDEAAPKDI